MEINGKEAKLTGLEFRFPDNMDWEQFLVKPQRKFEYVVGIDPDIEKSGVAFLNVNERRFERVQAMTFPELLAYIDKLAALVGEFRPLLVIEDSDSSTNWHLHKVKASGLSLDRKLRIAAAIGRSAGMCHAVIRLLNEYAQARDVDVCMKKPLRKTWRGADGKITHLECAQFMNGLPKRTSQETRDACLLCWVVAGLPIRLKV